VSVYLIRVRNPNNGKEATLYTTKIAVQQAISKKTQKARLDTIAISAPLEDFADADLAIEVLAHLLA
jgi:hypothetical protein